MDVLLANPAKANRVLGWQPEVSFPELVRMMVDSDMAHLQHEGSKYAPRLAVTEAAA